MRDNFNDVVTLIAVTETSVNGVLTTTESTTDVFCSTYSVSRQVKDQAGTYSVQNEIKVTLPDVIEYSGEKFAEYGGKRYEITKTYQNGYQIELTLVRGVH